LERIEKDLRMFENNLSKFSPSTKVEEEILSLAKDYYNDAKYYLEKGDLFTAFGCINYAHGLLDALIKLK
jgi:hypothetical protein